MKTGNTFHKVYKETGPGTVAYWLKSASCTDQDPIWAPACGLTAPFLILLLACGQDKRVGSERINSKMM